MTFSQINCFLCAAELKSFSKASESLYITRPAVSKQVSQLEEELGFPLFTRSSGGLMLTESGKMMYSVFKQASTIITDAIALGRHNFHQEADRIRIGCLWGWDYDKVFRRLFASLSDQFPSLDISLKGYGYLDMLPALKQGNIDYIIGFDSYLTTESELQYRQFASTGGMLVFSSRSPQNKLKNPTLKDFQNDTFFVSSNQANPTAASTPLLSACADAGFKPRIEVVSDGTIIRRVQNGQGVWVADKWFTLSSRSLFRTIDVDTTYNVCLGWLPSVSSAKWHKPFLDTFLKLCEENPISEA